MHWRKEVVLVACVLAWSTAAPCQDSDPAAARLRVASIVGGVGNDMGWNGAQFERYLKGGRVSVFVGLGYTLSVEDGDASGLTAALGARVFTRGKKHRGLLELSVSQITTEFFMVDGEKYAGPRRYGPGVQVGYQYVSDNGITVLLSGGVGYAVDANPGLSRTWPLVGIGVGYTWRK